METVLHDIDMLWTLDLAVGCVAMDERNALMLDQLAGAEPVIAAGDDTALAAWLAARYEQFDTLLREEERELASAGYPELAFHQRLHDRARAILADGRSQLQRADSSQALETLARESCLALALWLPRHVIDADRLFLPYVDQRFRAA